MIQSIILIANTVIGSPSCLNDLNDFISCYQYSTYSIQIGYLPIYLNGLFSFSGSLQ